MFEVKLELTPSMLSRIPAYVQMLIHNKKPSCHIINLKKKDQLWWLLFFNKKITNKTGTSFHHTGNQTHHHVPKPASRLHEGSNLSKHWSNSEARLWRSTRGVTSGWRNCCRCDKIFAWMSSTWCHIGAPNSTLRKIVEIQGLFKEKIYTKFNAKYNINIQF